MGQGVHTLNPEGNEAGMLQKVKFISLSSFPVLIASHNFLLLLGKMELLINNSKVLTLTSSFIDQTFW